MPRLKETRKLHQGGWVNWLFWFLSIVIGVFYRIGKVRCTATIIKEVFGLIEEHFCIVARGKWRIWFILIIYAWLTELALCLLDLCLWQDESINDSLVCRLIEDQIICGVVEASLGLFDHRRRLYHRFRGTQRFLESLLTNRDRTYPDILRDRLIVRASKWNWRTVEFLIKLELYVLLIDEMSVRDLILFFLFFMLSSA